MKLRSGFTLIELMIVVSIIGFLSMIAVPGFMKYLAKAKRSEAFMHLGSVYMAQKLHWAEHGSYTDNLSGPGGLGWKPEGYTRGGKNEHFYYTYGFGKGAEGINYFTGKLECAAQHLQKAHADRTSFLVVAAADILGKGTVDVIGINENHEMIIIQDGLQA